MAHENDVTVPLAPQQAPDSPKASAQQPAQPQVHPAEDATQAQEAQRPTVIGLDDANQQNASTSTNADAQATQPIGGQAADSGPGSTQPFPNSGPNAQDTQTDAPTSPEVEEKVAAQMEYLRAKEQFKAASKKAGKRTPQIAASIAIAAVLLFGGGAAGWAIGSTGSHADTASAKAPHAIESEQGDSASPRGYLNAPDGTNGDNSRGYGYRGTPNDNENGSGNQQAPDGTFGQQAPNGGFGQQGAPGAPGAPDSGGNNGNSNSDYGKQAPPNSGNDSNGSGDGNDSGSSDSSKDSGSKDSNNSDSGKPDADNQRNGKNGTSKPNNNGSDTGSFWNGNSGK